MVAVSRLLSGFCQVSNTTVTKQQVPTCQPAALGAVALLQLLLVLERSKAQDVVHYAALGNLVQQLRAELALAAKAAGLQGERVLCLLFWCVLLLDACVNVGVRMCCDWVWLFNWIEQQPDHHHHKITTIIRPQA